MMFDSSVLSFELNQEKQESKYPFRTKEI